MGKDDKYWIPNEVAYLGDIDKSIDVQKLLLGSVADQLAQLRRALADLEARTNRSFADVSLNETGVAEGVVGSSLAERSRLGGEYQFHVEAGQMVTLRLVGDFRRRYQMPCSIFGFFEIDPPGEGAHVSFSAMDHSVAITKEFWLDPGSYAVHFQLRAYTHAAEDPIFDDTFQGWAPAGTYAQVSLG